MGEWARGATLVVATVTTGLVAGLFYAYACSVLPGLRGAADRTSIDVMQRINVAIRNGWFALSFVGSLVATAAAATLQFGGGRSAVLLPTLGALACHVLAVVVTAGVSIPLNNALAAAGPVDRIADPAAVRRRFDVPWARWNLVRALLSIAALGLLCWALVQYGRWDPAGAA